MANDHALGGCSPPTSPLMTASRAINNRSGVSRETREHVLRSLPTSATSSIVPRKSSPAERVTSSASSPPIRATNTRLLIAGVSDAAWESGYETLIYAHRGARKRPSGQRHAAAAPDLGRRDRRSADGIWLFGELASTSIPVITVDQRGKHAEFPSIAADAYDGARGPSNI